MTTTEIAAIDLELPEPPNGASNEMLAAHWHRVVLLCGNSTLEAAARCGEVLVEQKSICQQNGIKWKEWCECLPFSHSHATRYMKVSSNWSRLEEVARVQPDEPLSIRGALKLLKADKGDDAVAEESEVEATDDELMDRGRIITSLDDVSGQKFATIMADPPWSYGNQATRASTDNHYVTMSVEDICAMPVADLAADDAQLHLWTTNGFLREAFSVMEAWGFAYRGVFVWCKSADGTDADDVDMDAPPKATIGIGNYWRVSHEFLLLGIRGSATFEDKSLPSWAAMKRVKHSAKPESVRVMVESAFHGPRLELFGRMAAPGWTVFGNQVKRSLFAG
jgi:N6-adenosine-specific RNA methylase IME4